MIKVWEHEKWGLGIRVGLGHLGLGVKFTSIAGVRCLEIMVLALTIWVEHWAYFEDWEAIEEFNKELE